MPTTLNDILKSTSARVQATRSQRRVFEQEVAASTPPPDFAVALRAGTVSVVAEIKRRSPSAGVIAPNLDPVQLARDYVYGGAAAISVLTEPEFFGGSLEDLRKVRSATPLPILRKDFVLDPIQVLEARAAGASAILLIARALDDIQLAELHACATDLGLAAVVETHGPDELERAMQIGPSIVGINSRDLDTFSVDVDRILPMLRRIPPEILAIAESGIESRTDVEKVAEAGADAVLIGTHLARQKMPSEAVRALVGIPRVDRAALYEGSP